MTLFEGFYQQMPEAVDMDTTAELLEMADVIGKDNVELLLDQIINFRTEDTSA